MAGAGIGDSSLIGGAIVQRMTSRRAMQNAAVTMAAINGFSD
jgi:hypothetical protein